MLAPPELWPSVNTPAAEVPAIRDLSANLWGVAWNVEAWASSLRLYEYAKGRPAGVSADDARRWKFIASNECVHELHHLRERFEKIKGHKLRACPSLAPGIDTKGLRSASKRLDEYFPGIDQLRHAIAHAGANDVLPQAHATEHGYLLVGFPEPDRYTAPYQGVKYHLDITAASLARINEVAQAFMDAFAPAALVLKQEGYLE